MASIAPVTKEQYIFIAKSCVPLNILSLISTIISCVTFGFIRIYYPNYADRVSFRLSFAALICDIGYSVHVLITLIWDNTPGFLCVYTTWAVVFFGLISLFFIVCIALNLHMIFIRECGGHYNFEKYYFIISFSFALLLSLLPLAGHMYGYDDPESSCWYVDSGKEHNIIWQWLTLFGWIDLSILYCAIIVIMVVIKLRSVDIDDDLGSSTSQLSGSPVLINKKVISSVVRRVVWYPVVPLVAQFCNSFLETYAYVNRTVSYPLLLLCTIGMSIQGLLNAIVFSQDIAVTRAFQAVKLHWWITNVNTYESLYPHLSHNKGIINELNRLGKSNDFIELKTLNCNKAKVIKNENVINDDINNNNNNLHHHLNIIVINNNNNNLVLQPSFLEWLRYMLLIKLFSVPKISSESLSQIDSCSGNKNNISSTLYGKNYSKQDITFANQNDDHKIHLVLPETVHFKDSSTSSTSSPSSTSSTSNLLPNCANPSISFDPLIGSSKGNKSSQTNISGINTRSFSPTSHLIDIPKCTAGNDNGWVGVKVVNGEQTRRVSDEFINGFSSDIDKSQDIEEFNLILKKL
ncbi:hypothetical protein F8M41_009365 [Gigaspora margarita]|uniref:G-protein coupled receptors family 2 profile 2 domain-containing protein n=1 Tax=Gigaspora margarita TaxID=4874 RepID=A0A8H3X2A3_GIGMA|nr:hypothetical protein F8M41_009365 [Gigaspora margarita]